MKQPNASNTLIFNKTNIYFILSYLLVLWLSASAISFSAIYAEGWLPIGFLCVTFLLYGFLYLVPAITLTALSRFTCKLLSINTQRITSAVTVLSVAVTTLLLYANAKIFALYGMYINGFIINLLITPGGIESLGGSAASDAGFAAITLFFIAAQAFFLWLATWLAKFVNTLFVNNKFANNKYWVNLSFHISRAFLPAVVFITVATHMGFAFDRYTKNQLASTAENIPFYQTVSAGGFYESLGFTQQRSGKLRVSGKLNYPLNPIQFKQPAKPYNIIWLTSESWRADMLNDTATSQRIMPNTLQFANQAARYTRNYSGGNGTRMGVFSMFMGMPGNYWFPFLQAQRGAAFIDVLQQQQYQTSFYTSAKFSYPEFSKTIFAAVPAAQLHDENKGATGWENDRDNVTNLLSFIDQRDTAKPFFTFMFFESPHARYYFPEDAAIAKPYRDDLNYATLSKEQLRKDIIPIKNRYINSVHHLDMQFGRIFDYLKENQLLDNTIVVINGDHGEEFMEHGFWGHNSTFVDEQVLTPLVIYALGMKPVVSKQMTSHMDIIPTIMPLLGVTNPSKDYALGANLFKGETRNHTYIADWDRVVYVDDDVKITQPVNTQGFAMMKVSKADDTQFSEQERKAVLATKQSAMLQLMQDLSHFFKKKVSASATK